MIDGITGLAPVLSNDWTRTETAVVDGLWGISGVEQHRIVKTPDAPH